MIAFDVLSEYTVTTESLYLDPVIAWHVPLKSVASRDSGWYISRDVLFLGGFVALVIQAWHFNRLAREVYARLPHPSRPSGFSLHAANRAHPSHGSLPLIHSLPHIRSLHRHLVHARQRRTSSPATLDPRTLLPPPYASHEHPSSILLFGPPLPPPQWVSAISPRYASAHLYRCVPWWEQSRPSLDHTSRSRNATRGRLSWQTQSSSRAPLGLRTSLR